MSCEAYIWYMSEANGQTSYTSKGELVCAVVAIFCVAEEMSSRNLLVPRRESGNVIPM